MSRTITKDGIKKRLAICEHRDGDPQASIRDLAAEHGAGHRLVEDAIRGGTARWKAMLGETARRGKAVDQPTSLAIVAEPVLKQGTVTGYRYKAEPGDGAWVEAQGKTVHAVLRALRQEGWHLVALVKVSGREPFTGTYELYLCK